MFADVDRDKTLKQGVELQDVTPNLARLHGSLFVNYFNRFGRAWQVYIAAESGYRTKAEDAKKFYVRNAKGEMLPLSSVISIGTQATSLRNCWIALCNIGPWRQTTAEFSSTKKPIDITLTPPRESQRQDFALAVDLGLVVDAEHAWDRVAVDVAVKGAGRVPFGGQGSGEVGGHR